MKIASAIATLALLSSPATRAQSVEGFDASRATNGGVPAELSSYIESVSGRLAIKDRETDVFGRYQDPTRGTISPATKSKGVAPKLRRPIEIKAKPQYGPVDRIIRPDHPTNLIADSRLLK